MNETKLMMKVSDAIEAGKDKKGKTIQIPIFDSIQIIDGELHGVILGYADPPANIVEDNSINH